MTRLRCPSVPVPVLVLCCLAALSVPRTRAADRNRERGETRLAELGVFFEALQADPTRAVPSEILREARGLVVLRETKAGFVLGAKSGTGVALMRRGEDWTWPAFYRSREGGIGLQAGWQKATFVHVLMTEVAVAAFRTNDFRFGIGLRVTSGPKTMGDEAKTQSLGADVLVYSDTGGLFGGLALEGSSVRPDVRANREYYGHTAEVLLFGPPSGADAPAGAAKFLDLVRRASTTKSTPAPGGG